jgi:hypothetical protein
VWSTTLARLLTAGTVGVGLGVVVAAVLAVRRHDRASSRAPAARAGAAEQTSLDITDDLLIRGPGT